MPDKQRVVLVGCGGMSAAWLKAAAELPDLEIVGLVDIQREAAERRAAEFDGDDDMVKLELDPFA